MRSGATHEHLNMDRWTFPAYQHQVRTHAPFVPSSLPIIRSISSSPSIPSAFPLPLPLPSVVNLRYLSLSGIHYRFYWGQSRQTDRVQRRTDGGNETELGRQATTGRADGGRTDGRAECEWIMPRRYSTPGPLRSAASGVPVPLRCSAAPLQPETSVLAHSGAHARLSSPRGDGSRPDL